MLLNRKILATVERQEVKLAGKIVAAPLGVGGAAVILCDCAIIELAFSDDRRKGVKV